MRFRRFSLRQCGFRLRELFFFGWMRAERQFALYFGIAMGYGGMHFSKTDTKSGGTLTISPTLHGPTFRFGIFFWP